MSKQAFYFQHDYEAVNDPKITALLYEFGAVGYGIWWRIVEMLHSEDDHCIKKKPYILTAIASQLKVEVDQVKQVLEYACEVCELLEQDEESYWSARVMRNLEKREELKKKKREAGRKGGKSKGSNDDQPTVDAQADADLEQINELSETKHIQAGAKQNEAGAKHVLDSAKQKQAKERKGKERKENNINTHTNARAREKPENVDALDEQPRDGPKVTPSEQEWMNFCTMHAFHPEYAQHIYDQMESVGWRDAQGRLVTNWQSHAKNKFKYQNQFLESLKHEKRKSNFTSTGDKVGGIYRQIAEQAY